MFDQLVTFLYTRDLDKSATFYGETLGLPLVLDQGACRIFKTRPEGFLGTSRWSAQRAANPDCVPITVGT